MNANNPAITLAIDTASSVFSVALEAAAEQWYFEADAGTRHAQLVMEIADILFKKASLKPSDLSRVVCMNGPGSFTGLRIGFSCAKGLALSLDIPFTAISSLDCMAYPYSMWPGFVMPVIDAKKRAWFCALYSGGERLTGDMDAGAGAIAGIITKNILRQDAKAELLLTGPQCGKLYNELIAIPWPEENVKIKTAPGSRSGCDRELLAIAKNQKITDSGKINYNSGPEYIRKSDAEINIGR
ncbi:MAG: tRNA (adenosine(37)-N6)-threonylcarbamoyltransferase complex dimerization subunit type 1 TsaB [Treponema sp.]|jgi:tRNA threonylcarbamoyladenosine biosynthesis protein TsaB|nr:tRNA (adenosine(37)-N6)-threonylcarbamoyltransferase complex dimerization subunit type 1 TsaB [Treponema sp.]